LLEAGLANDFLLIICTASFYIIIHNTTKQISNQKRIDNSSGTLFDDDEGKDFSLTAVAQWTNLLWLWVVAIVCIICAGYLFSYIAFMRLNIEWGSLLILSLFTTPFFVSCAFTPEHSWVYMSVFIVGVPLVLTAHTLYILLPWNGESICYLWRLVVPCIELAGYLSYILYFRKKKMDIIKNFRISSFVYFFAAGLPLALLVASM
jgi:hypothetical protein